MGAGSSIPSGAGLTRADVLKATEQPRLIVSRLFNVFVDNIEKTDILALANPNRCQDYVFVMADALDRLFHELRLNPGQDKKGVLYFRKVQEMSKVDPSSAEGQERKILCISLAFFYIRIFQIYAALSLSVNDDISYGSGQHYMVRQRLELGKVGPMRAPGLGNQILYSGGATEENIPKFNILKNYISRDPTRPSGTFVFDRYPSLIINVRGEVRNLTILKPTPTVSGPATITCNFSIKRNPNSTQQYFIAFIEFKANDTEYNDRLKTHGPFRYVIFDKGGNIYEAENGVSIDSIINSVMTTARDVAIGTQVPHRIRAPRGALGIEDVYRGAQGATEVGVSEGMRSKDLIAKLRQVPKPLAHCVARSLQLLDADALSTTKILPSVRTSICKLKFETAAGGLPDVSTSITRSPGILALQQLFYDNIISGTPSMTDEASASYQSFVKTMAQQFTETDNPITKTLGNIENRIDKICSGSPTKRDKILTVKDQNTIRTAKEAVQMLWKFQIEHDKKAVEILSLLVIVKKTPTGGVSTVINPLILQKGIPGVALVGKLARELLVKYYSNCEKTFRIAAGPLAASGVPIL